MKLSRTFQHSVIQNEKQKLLEMNKTKKKIVGEDWNIMINLQT